MVAGAGTLLLSMRPAPPPGPAGGAGEGLTAAIIDIAADDSGRLPEGWRLTLPADHGAHGEAGAESWGISAHLRDDRGRDLWVQFALFRGSLAARDAPQASAWVPHEIYAARLSLLRDGQARPAVEERANRGVLGLAGHDEARRAIQIDGWSIAYGRGDREEGIRLEAAIGDTALVLDLEPEKPALAPGGGEAAPPFLGYAMTRLRVTGYATEGEERRTVLGLAWMDHVWGDIPLPGGPIVWDRLQLQLDDGSELAVVRSRRRDGGGTPTLDGFLVAPSGEAQPLESTSVTLEAERVWRDGSGLSFPVDWRLSGDGMDLAVTALVDDQVATFGEPIWAGAVAAHGEVNGRPVSGLGTLQLSGYQTE
jgi:predicted secreted hydrolase